VAEDPLEDSVSGGDEPPATERAGVVAAEGTTEKITVSVSNRPISRPLIFAIAAIALFMGAVDLTMVSTAIPAVQRSLHTTINWTGWTITIYGLGNAVILPIAGKFSDQFGRRNVFLAGTALFTLSSLACGLSTNIGMLIVFRALQAIGGGALQPSAAGLVADHFGKNRDRAIGMFGTVSAAGAVSGPVIGGILVSYASWRWIFFVNVPIGVVLVTLLLRFVPTSAKRPVAGQDLLGIVLLCGSVLSGILGVSLLGNARSHFYDPEFLLLESAAIVLFWRFIRHSASVPQPFVPIRYLRGRGFAAANWLNFFVGAISFGVSALIPLYAQDRYGLSQLSSGTLLTSRAAATVVVSVFAAMAIRKTGYRLPIFVGMVVSACGILLVSVGPRFGIGAYVWLSIGAGITGLGVGAASPASRNASLQLAPENVAAIIGLRSMFLYLGAVFNIAIVTSILSRASHPAIAQAHVFWFTAALTIFVICPLVTRIPDHKGSW
jgi:EmrB/QacA subfamily drug resistance transporter